MDQSSPFNVQREALLDLQQVGDLLVSAGPRAFLAIVDAFEGTARDLVDQVESALRDNDVETAMAALHALKGSSANVGASALEHLFAGVENNIRDGASTLKDLASAIEPSLSETITALRAQAGAIRSDRGPLT